MSYIGFAWITAILYAVSIIAAKISTKHHIANPWLYNFVWTVLAVACILPIYLFVPIGVPTDWGSMVLLGFLSAITGIFYVLAVYAVDISMLSPLYILRTPLAVLWAVVFLGERLSLIQVGLIGLLFIAGLFVGLDERLHIRSLVNRGLTVALLAILSSSIYNTYVKFVSLHNTYWTTIFWVNIMTLVFILPTIALCWNDIRRTPLLRYQSLFWSTIFSEAGFLTSYKALVTNVSISIAIASVPFSMLFAIALSVITPKLLEKHTPKVYAIRLTAAAVMFAAALGLSR